ncbi:MULTISPECIES: DUF262 domain-containing protein [Shewanella]|uniref:DUF262 domain-containing protein n=1 Tax=Shewanella TaxID=22 RepID=UPI000C45B6A9|nr:MULTISPECIES: DUF262 domain-containing protein [Shewanella]NCO71593.1 DUF262 domain-containing protein [Shewanella vesiculosa]NCP73456.1 DUF262 domain-containing protein [Shewanella vesiculosa]NCP92491.1 DUF262 domain-containing protein [Shewanella vesiculosa]NCP99434.1 DUF262 domain-containing protein [Shewanella vesiculosa]NCQ44449.1 DUF262 domain-containing protein [Shewanella frigidimarina]
MANKQLDMQNEDAQQRLDEAIKIQSRVTDSDIREYPLSVIKDKFTKGLESDEAELFVPDYQREFVWSEKQRSRFIESLLLNLPIPYIFVADVGEGDNEGRLEIIDGSQRIRTIVSFLTDDLRLEELKQISEANGFTFSQLSRPTQLRFARKTIRMIELTQFANEETRREIFDRLNTGGKNLVKMEQRRGSEDGPFLTFVEKLSKDPIFRSICPLTEARIKRAEYPELVLRFFAYKDNYKEFVKSVDEFLTNYLQAKNEDFDENELQKNFHDMCKFVDVYFPNGFRKEAKHATVPRIRFEAISVGTMLALQNNSNLVPENVANWLNSDRFIFHTRSDASNSKPKVKARIEYVRNMLLGLPEGEDI